MKPIKTAIFPVGGLGTRFLPATKAMPKEMLTILNKPLIQYAFEEAVEAGIERFIFIIGRNKNVIVNHFDHAFELQHVLNDLQKNELLERTKGWLPKAGQISFIRQQEPKGLGHAIWCARNFLKDEPFAVLLPDEVFITQSGNNLLKQMIGFYSAKDNEELNVVAIQGVAKEDVNRYGIAVLADDNKIVQMVEKPAIGKVPSNLSIVGRYILQPTIFDYFDEVVLDSALNNDKEIQLTYAMQVMLDNNHPYHGFFFEGSRYDCGNPMGLLEANIMVALQSAEYQSSVKNMLNKIK